jgi:1-acyl-sn-glycerol-3-phosphate acyltransferase
VHRGLSYRAARAVLRLLVTATTRRRWTGTERLPSSGAALLAVNHLSFWDPVLVAYFVDESGRAPRFLAKRELFSWPVLGPVLRRTGQIPVSRASATAARAGDAAVEALRRGECVVVYPEGTLTRDPDLWPMRARNGVARIALTSGAPVLPVAQWGVQDIAPPWSKRLRPVPRHDVRIAVGEAVDLSDLSGAPLTRDVLDEATERVMSAITAVLADLRGESPPAIRFDPARMASSEPRDERWPRPMDTTANDRPGEGRS